MFTLTLISAQLTTERIERKQWKFSWGSLFFSVYLLEEYDSLLQEGDDMGTITYRGACSSGSYCDHSIR